LGTRESRLIPQKDDYEGIEFSPFYFFWVYKKAVLSVVPLGSIWKRKVEKPLLDKEYLIKTFLTGTKCNSLTFTDIENRLKTQYGPLFYATAVIISSLKGEKKNGEHYYENEMV
jgi:hypothetical protein